MSATGSRMRAAPHGPAVRTLPEQIADDLGEAIARGDFAGGERLLEQAISERYGVSRGPVREALRLLAQRGMAVLYPRRGAFVVEMSLGSLVDLFNMRAVLMGLAARYFAVMASDEARGMLDATLEQMEADSFVDDGDPARFVQLVTRIGHCLSRNCGSPSLSRLIEYQNDNSAWRTLWRSGWIDFQSRERRLGATADYADMGAAVRRMDGALAESKMRHILMVSRDHSVAALAKNRGETYDSRRLLNA
jgi:DNA-binding GntR family transcriptional regulator